MADIEILFIENVGNLVCPASWDLGESLRIALLSVTEGEDKPLKYPGLFNTCDVTLITKTDLAEACEFNRKAALDNIQAVRPGMQVFETSARTGFGVDHWIHFLHNARQATVTQARMTQARMTQARMTQATVTQATVTGTAIPKPESSASEMPSAHSTGA